MEFVRLLLAIRRRWKPLVGGAVVAIGLAVTMSRSAPSTSALAWTRVTLDTPKSQLVESDPRGADSLPWRASLLVHLRRTDESVADLARRTGVRPDEVTVVDSALAEPEVPASMPVSAAEAASFTVAPYVLKVSIRVTELPMITLEAAAPDRAGATRLAESAVEILRRRSSPSETPYRSRVLTGGGAALKYQPYTIEPVAPVRSKVIVSAAAPTKQVGVLFLYVAWCTAVLLVPALVRRLVRQPVSV